MGIFESYLSTFKKYVEFSGRASRSEYWTFVLLNMLAMAIFATLRAPVIVGIYGVTMIMPTLAVAIRRLHDTNKSGWFYLITLIPFGGLVLFIFYLLPSDEGSNDYGILEQL